MFTIGRNFHIIHMTDDLAALDAWYDDVFSVTRWMHQQFSDVLVRDASLVGIGDLCIEPMVPSFRVEGWDKVPVGRFYKRFGHRWHSIAWYVDDREQLAELYHALRDADVRILSGTGVPMNEGEPPGGLFTHPADTVTQLEFIVPNPTGLQDPRVHPSYRATWWHDTHPLHIRKSSHVTLAVHDLPQAKAIYVDALRGQVLHEATMPFMGTRSAFVAVGTDLVIELAEPLESGTPIADDLRSRGRASLYSVTLQVEDLADAEKHLASKGVTSMRNDGITMLADPATTHGVEWAFTTMEIPNDPRADW